VNPRGVVIVVAVVALRVVMSLHSKGVLCVMREHVCVCVPGEFERVVCGVLANTWLKSLVGVVDRDGDVERGRQVKGIISEGLLRGCKRKLSGCVRMYVDVCVCVDVHERWGRKIKRGNKMKLIIKHV